MKYYILAHITEKRETVDRICKFLAKVPSVAIIDIYIVNDCNYEVMIESEIPEFDQIVASLTEVIRVTSVAGKPVNDSTCESDCKCFE